MGDNIFCTKESGRMTLTSTSIDGKESIFRSKYFLHDGIWPDSNLFNWEELKLLERMFYDHIIFYINFQITRLCVRIDKFLFDG